MLALQDEESHDWLVNYYWLRQVKVFKYPKMRTGVPIDGILNTRPPYVLPSARLNSASTVLLVMHCALRPA